MQYAFIELGLQAYLIDSQEMESVNMGEQLVVDGPRLDEQSSRIRVCYGVYIGQHGLPADQVEKDMLDSVGHWMGYLDGPTCHLIALQGVVACGSIPGEHAHRLAFAAAIQAPPEVLMRIGLQEPRALTAFVRSKNCSPIDNVLNRSGVFAFCAQVTDPADVRLANWLDVVDREKARYAASKVG